MKTRQTILSVASIIPLLTSCASYQKTADSEVWSIKPLYNIRHSAETPESFYQLGRYYQGQNRYEQALDAYQKALAIDNTFAEARNGLGVIYATQGRQQEAIDQFRMAVKQAPNAAHIHNNLGYALYLGRSYTEAVSALERAVALNPANQAAHTNLALALDKADNREKAVQVMAQVANLQSAGNAPLNQEAQRASTGIPLPAPTPAVAATAIPVQAPQQVLALPKDWGVITQGAPKPVPLVAASSTQAVQLAPDVHEPRESAEVRVQAVSAAKPLQPSSVQPKEPDMVVAQAAQKAAPVTEIRDQSARPFVEQRVRAAAPAGGRYRIEVSNGNGVTGMAKKVAGFLDKYGYSKARLTNKKPFQITSSQVQYRAGYREQAQLLTLTLPGQPGIAQADNLRGDISIRVVLGKDIAGKVAYFEQGGDKIRLARY